MFKEDIKPTTHHSKCIADIFDAIIFQHEKGNDKRMVDFYKALKNIILQIYETDNAYTYDFNTAFHVLSEYFKQYGFE